MRFGKLIDAFFDIKSSKVELSFKSSKSSKFRKKIALNPFAHPPQKKDDDPEREKKKKDAKMKQEALQEREQQKRADLTALAATQRKRPNTGNVS